MIKTSLYMVTILTTTTIFCDTIHFTNSENRLLNSTNHTVYRVNVPGAAPITIIEADQVEQTRNDRDDDRDESESTMSHDNGANRRLGTTSGAGSAPNKKTVYSPALLEKFLQDYSDKIQTAADDYNPETDGGEHSAETIQEKLDAIAKLTQQIATEPNLPADEQQFYADNETDDDGSDHDTIQEKYAGHHHADRNKKYQHYGGHNSPEVNRFNDRDGWVTLDAIPWSNSKVSKWHPHTNKVTHFGHVSPVQTQWADEGDSYERPRPRPPHPYEQFPPSHAHDDEYYRPGSGNGGGGGNMRPGPNPEYYQPGYDALKPPQYGHHETDYHKPIDLNIYDDRDVRPAPMYDYHRPRPPTQEYYQSSPRPQVGRPTTATYQSDSWYNNKPAYRPHWDDDGIVTDGHPANFPQKLYDQRPPRPSSVYHEEDKYVPNYHQTASQTHPQTHPSTGNGEWVLISTTKGYHFPPKHGKRAMGFQTSNGSDEKTVRLTVLPAASTTSHKFVSVPNATQNQTEHTMVAAVTQSPTVVKTKTKAPPRVGQQKNRKKVLSSRNSGGDSTAVLAAVGAGMVPATVAMLMPMVLGRKRRDIERQDHRISYTMAN